jgi:hypothetical protein
MTRVDVYLGITLIIVLIVLILIFTRFLTTKSKFTQGETFFSMYEKEVNLFKSLSPIDQQEYLGMSKNAKIAKYGERLK